MKIIRKIALTELQSLFFSPIAWLILIIFTVQSSMAFTEAIGIMLRNQDMNQWVSNLTNYILTGFPQFSLFPQVTGYLYLYIPLLTMGLMSRELSSGSIKMLYSSPVTNSQIILGKYLSMMVYGLVMIAVLMVYMVCGCFMVENFDFPVALTGLLGIYLLICVYAAIGLFMSSLTSYQVIAGIGTLAALAALNYVGRIGQGIDFVRDLTYWLDMGGRVNGFLDGLISSEDLLYFLLVIALFLSLSILRLKAIRQKAKGSVVWAKYAIAVAAVFTLGYVTSRPAMKVYHDSTHTKQLTLTQNSQEIIKQATGPMTITTYVNALEDNLYTGLPRSRNGDRSRFEQYFRFKPEMKMKYVYYYAMPDGSDIGERFRGMSAQEMVGRVSRTYNLDSTMFKPASALPEAEMLREEGYRFLRIVERGDGRRAYLRIFDDMMRHPGEREITAALKRVVMDLPTVGFVSGHGERNINTEGDRGYFRFSQQRPFRYSLINQGFEVADITLDQPIPEHINIIVIADMRQAMTPPQEANLDAYIARGGNLLVAGDVNRQEIMNPLVERFGVNFLPGQVVRRGGAGREAEEGADGRDYSEMRFSRDDATKEEDFLPDFVVGNVTGEAAALAYGFGNMRERGRVVTMPGCLAINYNAASGFDVVPLLVSDDKDSWNELETKNFIDDEPFINAVVGEREESLPMGIALRRSIAGREQKVMVLGDADCISNGEISINRSNVRASNYDMIMATFYWLSDEEVPIDVRRPATIDNKLNVTATSLKTSGIWLTIVLPALMLIAGFVIWLRRRGR